MAQIIVGSEAMAAESATRQTLRSKYVMPHQNVYAPTGLLLTAHDHAIAAWLWSGRNATLAGYSAAAVLGSKWLPDDAPAELARIRQPSPPWILIHTGVIAADELHLVGEMRRPHLLRHRPTGIPGVTRMDDRAGQRPSTAVPAARDRRSGAQRPKALTPKLRVVTDSKRNPSGTVVSA
ncbi:hypothetical protein [Mycolicibacterium peregrinum]|uniref:Uncharacterized protein n=1 Tax=Mycolicibacterium peregrinum TaxID=43304 RepID=A0A1A0W4V3_MYCPR|nr:hypothetical protein [Mycolicibacterium peregrinum]OBB90928.1 hypothetical protein A5779_25005 [Mycolicibacterium peregrinum]